MEDRLFLSVAPGLDKSAWLSQQDVFRTIGPAPCYAQPSLPVADNGVFQGDSDTQTAVFHFTFDGIPVVDQLDGGVIVGLDGEQTWVSTGDPVMPVRQSTILLPQGTEITSLEATYLDQGIVLAGSVQLLAAPAAVPFGGGLETVDVWGSMLSGSFGQQDAASYSNHLLSGYHLGTLCVFPVEYDAAAEMLIYHASISVTVTVGAVEGEGSLALRDDQSDRLRVAELVDNPEALDGYALPAGTSQDASSALPTAEQYDYVVITSSAMESSFQPLVNQKISRRLSARIVTTEYIDANYSGTENGDEADKIRHFIADAYANWGTQWVLLGGDSEVIPCRGVYASVGSTVENHLPTDLYYACLDGPWNGDGDGLWGESHDGAGGSDIDLVPEVYIGRAPVSDVTEAANFVYKTIRYETAVHPNASTAVWLGEQLDEETWGSYSSIPIRDQTLPDDWNLTERYDSNGRWSGQDFFNDLNGGPHVVNHLGHANQTYNARLGNGNVAALRNDHPYFMYSQGCLSGSFDTHDTAIAELHLVHQYGAFGVVMNSRYGWYMRGSTPGASHYYAMEFWDAVFNEGRTRLGEANQDSRDDNLFRVGSTGVYRWIHLETNLFGDPETRFQIGDDAANTGQIQGTVWEDANADRQRQAGEPALPDQTVFLDLNDNGVLDLGTIAAAATQVPVDIPDSSTVTSTVTVSGAAPVTDVNVTLDVTHTYDSDLQVYLISPSGTKVELFTNVGGWGDNFTDTTLDDEAQTAIGDAAAPFTGAFRPESPLSRFDGEDPNGTWTLEVTDAMAWDTGTLDGWSLEIATAEPYAQTGPDGTYAFSQLAAGTYRVRHELPSDWSHTSPVDGVHTVEVGEGEVVEGVDFLATEGPLLPPATELGPVDFLEIADLNPAAGDLWYAWQTAHQGYLTVEARFQGAAGDLQLNLYDANLNPLAASTVSDSGVRIDWVAEAGQTCYFCVSGQVDDVDLRLANLVRQDGGAVAVVGTVGNDRFEFAAGDWHEVTINGVGYRFDSSVVTAVEFDGLSGDDEAVLRGSAGAETASMHPNHASLAGDGYQAAVTATETVLAIGGGGADVAKLYDSAGNDNLLATPDHAVLYGNGFCNYAVSFRYVHAYSVAGGTDVAKLYDSAGNDHLVATPAYGALYGDGFYNRAVAFGYLHAYAVAGGTDSAKLYDSAGDDTFIGTPDCGTLYGGGFYNRAVAFDYVHAYATAGGTDSAKLYDSAGDDAFIGTPEYGILYGGGFYNRAVAFDYVHAYAVAGGTDLAKLYDSGGDDTFIGYPDYAALYGGGFYNRAVAFRYVRAYSTAGGADTAALHDSALADYLEAGALWARLFNDDPISGFSNQVYGFDSVTAWSTGEDDVAQIDPAALDWLVAEGWD